MVTNDANSRSFLDGVTALQYSMILRVFQYCSIVQYSGYYQYLPEQNGNTGILPTLNKHWKVTTMPTGASGLYQNTYHRVQIPDSMAGGFFSIPVPNTVFHFGSHPSSGAYNRGHGDPRSKLG